MMFNKKWQEQSRIPEAIDGDVLCQELNDAFVACFGTDKYSEITRLGLNKVRVQSLFESVVSTRLGSWVEGWNYGEVGLANSWCCAEHSIFASNDQSLNDTVNRVIICVNQWRDAIDSLAALFGQLQNKLQHEPIREHVAQASESLVRFVVERNQASDAWYYTFQKVLGWYLEYLGIDYDSIEDQIELVIEGHFSSWAEPDPNEVAAAAKALGEAIQHAKPRRTRPSTTDIWLRHREMKWHGDPFIPTLAINADQHSRFIQDFDFERSQSRGEAMTAALRQCRKDATGQTPLDFDLLRTWQRIVLDSANDVDFRTTDAFAKKGRDYYPLQPATPKTFQRCLAECNKPKICVIERAARAYFDICFFHPFRDGNARSARLALDFVLSRNNLAINLPDVLFRLQRDPRSFSNFIGTLRSVVGQREF